MKTSLEAFFVLSLLFIFVAAVRFQYPLMVHKEYDILITEAVIPEVEPGATLCEQISPLTEPVPCTELLSSPLFPSEVAFEWSLDFFKKFYFNSSDLKAENLGIYELIFLYVTKYLIFCIDGFNTCILNGNYNLYRLALVAEFIYKPFQAAYPGLENVYLDQNDVMSLSLIALGHFTGEDSFKKYKMADFFATILSYIFDQDFSDDDIEDFGYGNLLSATCKYSKLAAYNLMVKNISWRNTEILLELSPRHLLQYFLGSKKRFMTILKTRIRNIDDAKVARHPKRHILIHMIQRGVFFTEPFLLPELKKTVIRRNDSKFTNFYSEALYWAIKSVNYPAAMFLLKLKSDYFKLDPEQSANSLSTQNTLNPVILEKLQTVFFSDSVHQITSNIPMLETFMFVDISICKITSTFKRHVPVFASLFQHLKNGLL